MRVLVAQGLAIAGISLFLHGVLLLISLWAYPPQSRVDAIAPEKTLFVTDQRSVGYGSIEAIPGPLDAACVVGSSNAFLGFRPEELQSLVPQAKIHNASLGGSNITDMNDVAEHVLACRGIDSSSGRTVIVAAIWYGAFQRNATETQKSNGKFGRLPGELARQTDRIVNFHLVLRNDHFRPFAPRLLDVLRPFLLVENAKDDMVRQIGPSIQQYKRYGIFDIGTLIPRKRVNVYQSLIREFSKFEREKFLAKAGRRMARPGSTFEGEQYEELEHLADTVSEAGATLIIVDCPLPTWHREGAPFYRDYRKRLLPTVANIQAEHDVLFVDLSEMKSDFIDATHPRDSATHEWSEGIAPAIRAALALPEHES